MAEPSNEPPAEAASSTRLTPHQADETDAPLGYYEYLPPGYGDGEPRPLLVFLHGFEGNGDGTAVQLDNVFETGLPRSSGRSVTMYDPHRSP